MVYVSKGKKRLGLLTPTYFMYTIYSKLYGYQVFNLPINPESANKLNITDLKKFLIKNSINLLVLVNPSHPFEKNWSKSEIESLLIFCKKKNILLILDEVYTSLGQKP